MKWHLRVVGNILIGSAVASGVSNGTPDERHGSPPLAVETFNVTADQIPAMRGALKRFASDEHLTIQEGGFLKQGRQVIQFYLKKNAQPAFYVDNFRNPLGFEATAYSQDSESVWKPQWLRLLSIIN